MMAARCEYQFRADWDLNPGFLSLSFTTKVNPGMSMPIERVFRRDAHSEKMKEGREQGEKEEGEKIRRDRLDSLDSRGAHDPLREYYGPFVL